MCCSVLVIIFILVLKLGRIAYNFYKLMLLLNEYATSQFYFKNLSLYNINNQLVNFWKKNHCRFYFRGTTLILNEHKFLLHLTFAVNVDLSSCIVTYNLTSKVPLLAVRGQNWHRFFLNYTQICLTIERDLKLSE